jgi:hypothetical protein
MNGWDEFLVWVENARATMEDRWAPVALIALQSTENADGSVTLLPDNDATIFWSATFPIDERGPFLARLAQRPFLTRLAGPYEAGTVLRRGVVEYTMPPITRIPPHQR